MTWTDELWSVSETNWNFGPETIPTYITHNLNSAVTFVALVATGDLRGMAVWYIDNVTVTAPNTSLPFSETFDAPGPSLPLYWATHLEGAGVADTWSVSGTNYADGQVNEIECYSPYVESGTTRLILPALNTLGRSGACRDFQTQLFQRWGRAAAEDPDEHEWSDMDG